MTTHIRAAHPGDTSLLLDLMPEFYAETDYPLDRNAAENAFTLLLENEALGRAWILSQDGADAGYAVLTLGFSMEFHGRDGFVDDLFVRPAYRGRGLGTLALDTVREMGRTLGLRALHLEVDPQNRVAVDLYRREGFSERTLRLMTLRY